MPSLMNLLARGQIDAKALVWCFEKANIPDTLQRILRDGPPVLACCLEDLRARVHEGLAVLDACEEFLRVRIEEPSRKGAPRQKLVLEDEAGARLVRYLRRNDVAFHFNLKQFEKEDVGRVEEAEQKTTYDESRERAAAVMVEANRKANVYRAEARNEANVPEVTARNEANVPEMAARNEANVPEMAARNEANRPEVTRTNKAELESSSEWRPEVSSGEALPKSFAIQEERRKSALAANPADPISSSVEVRVIPAQGAGLPQGGPGGGAPSSLLNTGG